MGGAREAWQAFFEADEVGPIREAWPRVLAAAGLASDAQGLDVFAALSDKVEPELPFGKKRIFALLETALGKRERVAAPRDVVVSGAGPVGLRAAVESALMGQRVAIVEKRESFSRANVLMLWPVTMADLVALGAKYFFPALRTQGDPLFMGTREIQLALLKTALVVGVRVIYGAEVAGIASEPSGWAVTVATKQGKSSGSRGSSGKRLSVRDAVKNALSFKTDRTGEYDVTFRCNMVDKPEVDPAFLRARSGGSGGGRIALPAHALLVAEGEWSSTCRRLGVHKTIDRFRKALGMVVNLTFDRSNAAEKAAQPFSLGFAPVSSAVRERLAGKGIHVEAIEYLRGTTHYIVASFGTPDSLIEKGVLRERLAGTELLSASNVDMAALNKLARDVAEAVGLPPSVAFFEHHPVQLFDFSARSRAYHAARYVTAAGPEVLDEPRRADDLQVMPIGDALLEPFWPQGLGSNRGFHGALDAAYAARLPDAREAFVERRFAYTAMNAYTWKSGVNVNPFDRWSCDPLDRYSDLVVETTKQMMADRGQPVPKRVLQQ